MLPALLAAAAAVFAQTGWVADATKPPLPKTPAKGTLFGKAFVPKVASIQKSGGQTLSSGGPEVRLDVYSFHLRTNDSVFPDAGVNMSLLVPKNRPIDGRTYLVRADRKADEYVPGLGGLKSPWVQGLDIEGAGGDLKVSSNYSENVFSLRLRFGKRAGNTLPGQIYLCVRDGDGHKHVVAGTFEATVER